MKSLKTNLVSVLGKETYDSWLLGNLLKSGKYSKSNVSIIENPLVSDWITSKIISNTSGTTKKLTKTTISSKRNIVKQFQDYVIYNEIAFENVEKLLKESQLERNNRVSIYIDYLMKLGKLENSTIVNSIQGSIMSWYSFNGKRISDYKETYKSGTSDKDELILTNDDVRNIVEGLNTQYQIAVMFMYGCGFRISDVLLELPSSKPNSIKAKYRFKKFKDHYYIKNFTTYKRQVQINYVFIPTELENTLKGTFGLDDLTKLDFTKLFMNRSAKNPKRIESKSVREAIEKRALKLDIIHKVDAFNTDGTLKKNNATKEPEKTFDLKFGNHTFRKFFTTKARDPELLFPEWLSNHYEGHANKDLTDSYQTKLKEINFMYAKWLLLQNEVVVRQPIIDRTSAEVKEVRLENEVLKEKVSSMEKSLNEKLLAIMELVENLELTKSDVKKAFGSKTVQEVDELSHE